jgi:hypothetical protein
MTSAWAASYPEMKKENVHEQCGTVCDMVMKYSLDKNTTDNITCIVIAFENYKDLLWGDYDDEGKYI